MSAFSKSYASLYDNLAAREDRRGGAGLRSLLVSEAHGRVLEIGTGTGRCLPHYRKAAQVVALEPDKDMRTRAERRSQLSQVPVEVVPGDAMHLPYPDASFDTVVTAWVLCTIPEPGRALGEIRRVLRPNGTLRFCEHVRSHDPALAKWQDRLARPWRWFARGCRCNQDTVALMEDARFDVTDRAEFLFEPSSPRIVSPTVLGVATPQG
jgi:ubiquinone/menaquinone biosynthesis C-methylase UbiE